MDGTAVSGRWLAASVFLFWGLALAPARAQDEEFIPNQEEATAEAIDFSVVDDMLRMDEEVLADPAIDAYDAASRRNPFRSQVRNRKAGPPERRPPGIAGLSIDEISLEGVFVLAKRLGSVMRAQTMMLPTVRS